MCLLEWTVENESLDELDRKILRFLMVDSKTSYKNIALEIGVSSATIKNRIEKMKHLGALKSFKILVDPKICFNYNISAFLHVTLHNPNLISKLHDELKQILGVLKVFITTGSNSQIITQIFVKNIEEYSRLMNQISIIEGIKEISSFIILNELNLVPIF